MASSLTSGLGNRLFQFAAAAGAAELWGCEVVFYLPACKESPHGPIASIFRLFPSIRIIDTQESYKELSEPPRRFYQYIPLGPRPPADHTLIHGFRQSPLYFPKELIPNWDSALGGPILRKKVETLAGLHTDAARKETYAVHVRLGDYKHLPHHQVDLSLYYSRALAKIPDGSRLHLFSDEPDISRNFFQGLAKRLRITIAVTNSDIDSLYEMSLCLGGTIAANSTFSWWGAWFAHSAGSAWATYPDSMGNGQPEPEDFFPEWGTVIKVK